MSERSYHFDPELRIWRTPAHDTIGYSDGGEVERRLLDNLKQCRDVSSGSDELRLHIVDWPSEYHFSSVRHNLFRPFLIDPEHHVLELGCGCGSITRYLGETGATVVAVEGSRTRAAIAAERCRDLPNVTVVCDNLAAFETDDRFDFATLIGVLEYSPLFIGGSDPIVSCINMAKAQLRQDGLLILAIENRLGLKYFSGCNEDHVGKPFFGIEGLYDDSTAVTLGRRELLAALASAGLSKFACFYPFPDYKLPSLIVADAGIADRRFRVEDLLLRNHSPDRVTPGPRSFSEPLAWSAICSNELLPDLSNSFLIAAGGKDASPDAKVRSFLALSFASNRLREYATETEFHVDNDEITVTKRAIHPSAHVGVAALAEFRLRYDSTAYLSGRMYLESLMRLCRTGLDVDQIALWAKPWTDILFAATSKGTLGKERLLPGDYFDCVPFNLLETADGCLNFIDREWQLGHPIPLDWVFVRGLSYALANCVCSAGADTTIRNVVREVAGRLGIQLGDEEFATATAREKVIQKAISGATCTVQSLESILDSAPLAVFPVFDAYLYSERRSAHLQASVDAMKESLEAMTASKSWRITAPLRAAQDALINLLSHLGRP